MSTGLEFRLVGGGGEPVDLWRTCISHGFAELPPMSLDESSRTVTVTLPVDRGRPRTVTIKRGRRGHGLVEVHGPGPSAAVGPKILTGVRHMLRLDEDLSPFYALTAGDPDLSWAARGAGRMLRSPTVFEDVVKTICTTNCAWSATVRMVGALVEHLGAQAAGDRAAGRAFPTPEVMADTPESFYREVVRAGYRGQYLVALSRSVAEGTTDLEVLALDRTLPDEEVEGRLLTLPGVGPYAAAHIMMTIGRYSRLILDSWTRPTYARLIGRRSVADKTILRRFKPYGHYAGLAFWLFLTRDWVED